VAEPATTQEAITQAISAASTVATSRQSLGQLMVDTDARDLPSWHPPAEQQHHFDHWS